MNIRSICFPYSYDGRPTRETEEVERSKKIKTTCKHLVTVSFPDAPNYHTN